MFWKKRLALLLAALLLVLTIPAYAAGSAFTDITDTDTAQNVEILQMLEVLNGITATTFEPNSTLTRAQFTKMAVMILGKGDQVAGYQNYTIFPDVKSSHWAAGYINLAVRGEEKFIAGFSNGTFGPDQTITFGQAITILMRLLSYTDADVGMTWPTGYLNAAASNGLTNGVSLGGESVISRAQAAKLFVNLLDTKMKEGAKTFGETVAASTVEDAILLDVDTEADDGALAIDTTGGTFKLAGTHTPLLMQGRRGTLLLDGKGLVMTFLPSKVGSVKDITVSTAKAGTITDRDGKEHTVNGTITTYYKGDKSTYGEVFVNLRAGTRLTLHFGATGKVECIVVADTSTDEAVVVGTNTNVTFSQLTGGRTDYTIYKNGETVTAAALRPYDVATYIPGEKRVHISNIRLTGYYENAFPNAEAPTSIKMMGSEFDVLPTAVSSLSNFKVGDQVTLLLTQDFQVAGGVSPSTLKVTNIGIAKVSEGKATVDLLEGITLSGEVPSNKSTLDGTLVTVSSTEAKKISIIQVKQASKSDSLDVAARKLGDKELSANVSIFERVSTGPVSEIRLEEIRLQKVSAESVLHAAYNDNGKVSLLVLENVTGNGYTYGRAKIGRLLRDSRDVIVGQDADGDPIYETKHYYEKAVTIENGEGAKGPYFSDDFSSDEWGGIVVNVGSWERIVSQIKLTALKDVTNENWRDDDLVEVKGTAYEVSDEVVCYNKTTGQWVTLNVARAFGDSMTLYIDGFQVVRGVQVG